MKLRKAMAVALAGALVITTFVTGTTSEAAKSKKTKLKTKKATISVKGKKKISITGKKAKHKYTFTSKKKKIAKVSKKGVITGVKAGKTKITVKDTWKQKGKKKSKKLGTVTVTVKKKTTPKPKVTAQVPQPPVTPIPAPPTQVPGDGNLTPTDNPVTPTPGVTPTKTPKVTKEPTPTPVATQAPPPPEEQVPTTYKPVDMSQVQKPENAGGDAVLTYDSETNTITAEKIAEFGIPLDFVAKNGHAVWVKIQGEITGNTGFRCWLHDSDPNVQDRCSNIWEGMMEPDFENGRVFNEEFQLVSYSNNATHLWIKGPAHGTPIAGLRITSIEVSYPLGEGEEPGPDDTQAPTAKIDLKNISEGSTTTAAVSVSAGEVKDVDWSVEDTTIATVAKDAKDPAKATITGVKAGHTKVTAKVKVAVDGKDVTVEAEKDLVVAGKDELVVNVEIETAPSEIGIGEQITLTAKADVDTASIEEIIWEISGDAATIETDSLEAAVTGVKEGKVTVTVTIKVKKDGKTGEVMASKDIEVVFVNKDFNMVLSPDTALKTAPWYFIDSSKNTYSDGGVSFLLPKDGNKATAFNLSESGELFDLSEYSKAVITLASSEENTAIRLGFTSDEKRDFKDPEVTNHTIGTAETKIEVDLAGLPASEVYSFVIQHTGWIGSSPDNPTVTIKSIKLIAK